MTPKGGARKGAGRPPAPLRGERKHFYLDPDNREWFNALPKGERSKVINDALKLLREQQAREGGQTGEGGEE